jgi:hypothetical protein
MFYAMWRRVAWYIYTEVLEEMIYTNYCIVHLETQLASRHQRQLQGEPEKPTITVWGSACLIDRVWIGRLDLLVPYLYHSELKAITALPLIYTIYSSLLQTLVSSVYYRLHQPFPGNGFLHRNYKSLTESHNQNITVLQHMQSLPFTAGLSTLNWNHPTPPSSANCQLRNSQSSSLLQLPSLLTYLHGAQLSTASSPHLTKYNHFAQFPKVLLLLCLPIHFLETGFSIAACTYTYAGNCLLPLPSNEIFRLSAVTSEY